ncbi:putative catalytic [Corchorus capsularis]|uniref:Putative catalytic n=1 Tax=Corchorus capsularis TaxID=210143 RepID=A0A1R3J154_COCAP|nr:putative catalytic [Corchorus capsularis]
MSFISHFTAPFQGQRAAFSSPDAQLKFHWLASINSRPTIRIARPFQNDTLDISRVGFGKVGRGREGSVRVALVNERLGNDRNVSEPSSVLAYELVQGKLVNWSPMVVLNRSIPEPPTAVLLHGILGSRKNWGSFARRLAQEFPTWQFVLVDLRCHGDSASMKKRGPNTVASTASDVLKLIAQLRITPRVLIGHSFGGKVALSMVEQVAKPLPRPVRVWVLDATPGKVRAGGDGEDHPAELISFLRKLTKEVSSKRDVVDSLVREGFSKDVAEETSMNYFPVKSVQASLVSGGWKCVIVSLADGNKTFEWVVTNLRPTAGIGSSSSSFSWVFDLEGIAEMYQSYEETNLWKVVENLPRGVHVNFLKAERSLHRWALEDLQRIHAAEEIASDEGGGVEMHVLEDAGHWVHADNPDGLFRILSFSFKGVRT